MYNFPPSWPCTHTRHLISRMNRSSSSTCSQAVSKMILRLKCSTPKYPPDEDSDLTTISYDALSYVWGSAENLKSITIAGICTNPRSGQLSVTENLAVALRHLRKQHEIRTLWIDAICINQRDLTERSTEVRKMSRIYKKACRTLVWLGPEEENSSLAVHLLQSILKDVYLESAYWKVRPRSETYEKTYSLDKFTSSKAGWVAFSKLCCRPWFSRLWVYQELHLSRIASAVVGLLEFDMKDLFKIVRAVRGMASKVT